MKKYFVKLTSRLLHSKIHQVMWYFWVFIVNPLSLLCSIFFLKKTLLPLVASPPAYRWVNQPRYFWQTYYGVFLENYSSFLNNIVNLTWWLNSIDWLLKRWWWIFFKEYLFYFILFIINKSLSIIVNVNFFNDLKFEYYCEYYPEILLQESLK